MPANYIQPTGMLELRQPAKLFGVIGWLAAGPGNPAGFFVQNLWGVSEFNYAVWAWHVAAPLELGILFAMFFAREGGYGIPALSAFVFFSVIGACAITGPAYTLVVWFSQQQGLSLGPPGWFPIYSLEAAVGVSGNFIRTSLTYAGPCIVTAIIILRLVSFQRVRPKPKASPSTPPPAPAA